MLSSRGNIFVGLVLLASFVQFAEKPKKKNHVIVYRDGFALSFFVFTPYTRYSFFSLSSNYNLQAFPLSFVFDIQHLIFDWVKQKREKISITMLGHLDYIVFISIHFYSFLFIL